MSLNFTGKMSTFGGPSDLDVEPNEGLALINESNFDLVKDFFLATQPPSTTGLARRLNPAKFYVACRWDYERTSPDFLIKTLVSVRNPANGLVQKAKPVDWGPNEGTGRSVDMSPGLASALGLATDDDVEVSISLGDGDDSAELKTIEETFFKKSTAQSLLLSSTEKLAIPKGKVFKYDRTSLKRVGEHYAVDLLDSAIAPWGKSGFFYSKHIQIGAKNNASGLVDLLLSDEYGDIQKEAFRIRGGTDNTCVAFASEVLRRLGIAVPIEDTPDGNISLTTKPFRTWLEENTQYVQIDNRNALIPGDICFAEDEPGFPTFPAHVYYFIDYDPDDRDAAYVVDNQDSYHIRNLDDGRPGKTPFQFALRLQNF
jgi:hypothetical protein